MLIPLACIVSRLNLTILHPLMIDIQFLLLTEIEFRPDVVFRSLYWDHCHAAWEAHALNPLQNCDAVQAHFIRLAAQRRPHRSSLTIRMGVLADFGTRWPGLNTPTACFFCICRPAEHMMPCRHAICDTCATILGSATRGAEYHVDLSQCPMCRRSFQLTVRQLPPTKRPVVITLDGGGIRGYITLGLLRALERRFAGAIKLPQIPDLFAGTSVGASIPFPHHSFPPQIMSRRLGLQARSCWCPYFCLH